MKRMLTSMVLLCMVNNLLDELALNPKRAYVVGKS